MTKQPAYAVREQALQEIETLLVSHAEIIELRFDRARLLTELGRSEEAKQAYLDILSRDPSHFGALNNLGVLLHAAGFRTAARTAYAEAVRHHPDNPKGHVNFANALLEQGDIAEAREHFDTALRLAPDHREAHQGLTKLFTILGDEQQALRHRPMGFQEQSVITLPYRGKASPRKVLLLISAAGGNIPVQQFLDDQTFLVSVVVAEFYDLSAPLPPHHLIINAIGDADLCKAGLDAAKKIIAHSRAPVINQPQAILATGRVMNATRLASIEHLIAPKAATLPRSLLTAPHALSHLAERGFAFPFLLRTPGYHTGHYFECVKNPAEFKAALTTLPGHELAVLQYLDARGADEKIRKYRVMMLGGQLYPVHVAISHQWKVHYFSAEMADQPAHRAEDAAFLDDMEGTLGFKAMAVLERMRDSLDLDYGGVDFGLNDEGDVLLFEANATMIVTPPAPGEIFLYRQPAVLRIFDAIRKMFREKAAL